MADLDGRLLKEGDTPYAHALAIQDYLRTSGGFTYSLALDQAKDSSGRPADLDPISNFLVTKQGYCVQFATAMTMMARAAGIPARMATGFLPGSATQGVWTVTAADAHAWPELYLDGVGWTRFEPTPAVRSGAPPIYAADLPVGNPATGGGRDISQPTRTARPQNPKQDVLDRVDDARENPIAALPVTPAAEPSLLDRLPRGWGLGLLSVLAGLLGGLVVPTAAAWHRRSRRRTASNPAEVVEAEWESLTGRLADLGMPAPPSRTPRQLREFYGREAFLDEDAAAGPRPRRADARAQSLRAAVGAGADHRARRGAGAQGRRGHPPQARPCSRRPLARQRRHPGPGPRSGAVAAAAGPGARARCPGPPPPWGVTGSAPPRRRCDRPTTGHSSAV